MLSVDTGPDAGKLNRIMLNQKFIGGSGHKKAEVLARKALKLREAAQVLGVSTKTVRRLIDRNKLRAVRVLRHLLIPITEIDRFLSGGNGIPK